MVNIMHHTQVNTYMQILYMHLLIRSHNVTRIYFGSNLWPADFTRRFAKPAMVFGSSLSAKRM